MQDLKINRVNNAAATRESKVLPRGVDHAADLASLSTSGQHVEVVVLDFVDAFKVMALREAEKPGNCAEVPELRGPVGKPYVAWRFLGFGG